MIVWKWNEIQSRIFWGDHSSSIMLLLIWNVSACWRWLDTTERWTINRKMTRPHPPRIDTERSCWSQWIENEFRPNGKCCCSWDLTHDRIEFARSSCFRRRYPRPRMGVEATIKQISPNPNYKWFFGSVFTLHTGAPDLRKSTHPRRSTQIWISDQSFQL